MTADYREGIILSALRTLKARADRVPAAPPVRLELGVELMNSTVDFPDRWERLLAAPARSGRRPGLGGRVLLSHNFSHHLEIPEDFLDRMTRAAGGPWPATSPAWTRSPCRSTWT